MVGMQEPRRGDDRRATRRLVPIGLLAALIGVPGPAGASDECGPVPARLLSHEDMRLLHAPRLEGAAITILAIGSSSTEGAGASDRARSYPARLELDLKAAFPGQEVSVVNAGVGGETADQTLRRLGRYMAMAAKPDLVLWQVGTNDAVKGVSERSFRTMVARGVGLVHRAGVELVMIDPQFYPRIPDVPLYEHYVQAIAEAGALYGVPVFSRYRLMQSWNEGQPQLLPAMLSADGFHMSDRGYACLAAALSGELVARSKSR